MNLRKYYSDLRNVEIFGIRPSRPVRSASPKRSSKTASPTNVSPDASPKLASPVELAKYKYSIPAAAARAPLVRRSVTDGTAKLDWFFEKIQHGSSEPDAKRGLVDFYSRNAAVCGAFPDFGSRDVFIIGVYEKSNPSLVIGGMVIVVTGKFLQTGEVYSVCADSHHTGDGVGSLLMDILSEPPFSGMKLSLGVDLTNPLYDKVVSLYVRSGFMVAEEATSLRASAAPPTSPVFLKLTRPRNADVTKAEVIKAVVFAKVLRTEFTPGNIPFHIHARELMPLRDLMSRKSEYGGDFYIDAVVNSHADLKVNPDLIVGFKSGEGFAVSIENRKGIVWHTHPRICYRKGTPTPCGYDACFIGWASGRDVSTLFRLHSTIFISIVVAMEGVWIYSITPAFRQELPKLKSAGLIEHIAEIIEHYYNMGLDWRLKRMSDDKEREWVIAHYLENKTTLSAIKRVLPTEYGQIEPFFPPDLAVNEVLLDIKVHSWKSIEDAGGIIGTYAAW